MSNALYITLSVVGAYMVVGILCSLADYALYRLDKKYEESQVEFPWILRAMGYTLATLIWPIYFYRTVIAIVTYIKNRKRLVIK
ncbi:hypothetical protein AB1I68_00475 [Paenibacillus pabuli]|uniref:hypothetical protein n=1 Tax=Paenibacillus pabuli TaxID=1472 RepID=UPI003459B47E